MTNMNPDYIKYETGYCNCRDDLVNNLVHKYVPMGSIIKTEDIKTLQKDNYKKIRVAAKDLDEKRFNLDGVTNLTSENGAVSFFYKGDINVVTRLISEKDIIDVSIEEPTLEEIFLHYYE